MPYKLRNKVRHKFAKARYKIINWNKYEKSLINRGDICFWFSKDVIERWYFSSKTKTIGRQFKYSELAIKTGLIIKIVFKLTYRSLEGFLGSVCKMMNIELDIPDHTIFSRRSSTIRDVELSKLKSRNKINVIIDSTGLRIFSEEEWLKEKYKLNKNKEWRKLHLAIDEKTQQIVATELTVLNASDNSMVKPLLESVNSKISKIIADKVYDTNQVYHDIFTTTKNYKIQIIIPARTNAKRICLFKTILNKREMNHKEWFTWGPYKWQDKTDYNKRSLIETAMMRYKKIIGEKLFSRKFINQQVESLLGSFVLNRMFDLGKPISIRA